MTARDQIRAMLDQLMGTARNGEDDKPKIKFDDARVCKSFLLGCCPHEILASTRMDLGDCVKIHNLALKADYELASKSKDYFYDLDAMEQLSQFVADADRKCEQARRRLAETQEELSGEVQVKADKIHELGEKIGETLARAEELGAEGQVDESMRMMEEIDRLRKQKGEAEAEYRSCIPAAAYQQQKLRVCDVCGAYLGIHDNDRRLADHFGGKLHLGFIKIRDTLKEFQAIAEDRRRSRRDALRMERMEEEERLRRKERSGRRSRSRSKSSERRRHRDRDDRRKRSRSRDRKNRSRSRDRDRKKSHHKDRKRSRSRERKRSSRSRSRSKSRDDRKDKEKARHSSDKKEKSSPPPVPVPVPEEEENPSARKSSMSEEESGEI